MVMFIIGTASKTKCLSIEYGIFNNQNYNEPYTCGKGNINLLSMVYSTMNTKTSFWCQCDTDKSSC